MPLICLICCLTTGSPDTFSGTVVSIDHQKHEVLVARSPTIGSRPEVTLIVSPQTHLEGWGGERVDLKRVQEELDKQAKVRVIVEYLRNRDYKEERPRRLEAVRIKFYVDNVPSTPK